MVCDPVAELSYSVRVAVRVPDAEGLKVTEMVQVAPAASVFPMGQLLVCEKSAALVPVMAMLETVSR